MNVSSMMGARMMGSHLLQHVSGIAIALLNFTGAAVFYSSFNDAFVNFTYSFPITIAAVIAIRLSFCILTHQAMASSGTQRYLCFAVVILIGLAPTLRTFGPIPMSIAVQLALDLLIVLLTASLHSSSRRMEKSYPRTTYVIPDRAIALDDVIESYGVNEFGTFFLYLPKPLRNGDLKARAWIEILKETKLIKSCYRVNASHATDAIRVAQPHLFNRKVDAFDVYRLDKNYLNRLSNYE